MIHLDTHVVVWLVGGRPDRLPVRLRRRLERDELGWSPMVRLELAYLRDLGRITADAGEVLSRLATAMDAREDRTAFPDVVTAASGLGFTRDPFDRLIAGHAIAAGASLATSDQTLLQHLPNALWDG